MYQNQISLLFLYRVILLVPRENMLLVNTAESNCQRKALVMLAAKLVTLIRNILQHTPAVFTWQKST